MKFFKCVSCGKTIELFNSPLENLFYEEEEMIELKANTSDGAGEKHVPVIEQDGQKVTVKIGSIEHPMVDTHFIQWVIIETKDGFQKKELKPDQEPYAQFVLTDNDSLVAAYEYCNLHGLWKADV